MTNFQPHYTMLPGQFGLVVREVAEATQAPIELVIAVALAAASAAVQDSCMVERKPGLKGPVSLFLITICESGERKSAVQALLFKAFADQERIWNEEAKRKTNDHSVNHKLWHEKVGVLRAELKRATRRNEPIEEIEHRLRATLESEPMLEKYRKMIYQDTTPEALLAGLNEGGNSASAALIYDEFGEFVDGFMSKKLPLLNSLWSGMDTSVDRKTGNSFVIQDARLTCLFQAQPAIFERFMEKPGQQARGNGFLSRNLIAFPISTQGSRFDYGHENNCYYLDWFHERCRNLLNNRKKRTLKFTPEAQSEWFRIANTYEENIQAGRCNSDIPDFASKAAENIGRMAAVLHGFMNDESDEINIEYLQASIDLVEWYRQQYQNLMLSKDPLLEEERDLDCLYQWVESTLQKGNRVILDRSYILQYGPNRLRKRGRMNHLIDILIYSGNFLMVPYGRKKFISIPRHA